MPSPLRSVGHRAGGVGQDPQLLMTASKSPELTTPSALMSAGHGGGPDTCTKQGENSEVFPFGSVAVAVMSEPAAGAPATTIEKLESPFSSVWAKPDPR